jgi:hypothetical protein
MFNLLHIYTCSYPQSLAFLQNLLMYAKLFNSHIGINYFVLYDFLAKLDLFDGLIMVV